MRKRRIFKYILIIILTFILLLSIGTALIIYFFPKEKILQFVSTEAEETLKRKVSIEGISYSLNGIMLKGIVIYDGLSNHDEILALSTSARINFKILPLLEKKLIINHIIINNLKVNICYKDGKYNLESIIEDLRGDFKQSTISTSISYITFQYAEIDFQNPPKYLQPLKGQYVFNSTIEFNSDDMIRISNCDLILPDKRGRLYSNALELVLDPNFTLSGDVNLKKCTFSWIYNWKKGFSQPYIYYTGNVNGLKITKRSVEGFAKGSALLSNSRMLDVDGFCRVKIPGKRVSITKLKASTKASKLSFDEINFTFEGIIKKINIRQADAAIRDIMPFLDFIPAELYGRVSGNILFENNKYNGTINLNNAGYKKGKISDINSEIIVSNNKFQKENIPLKIDNQPCLVSIASTDGNFKKFFINISSKELLFNSEGSIKSELKFTPLKLPISISGKIDIEKFKYDNYKLTNIMLNYSFSESSALIKRISVNFMDGEIHGKGVIDLSEKHPDFDFSIEFNKLKIQNFSQFNEQMNNRIFGVMDGDAIIKFRIEDDNNISKSFKGKINFNINKGKIVNTGMQKGLGIWLSELKYKLKDLEFDEMYGNLNIVDSNLYINSFKFNAPDIRIHIDGFFNKKLSGDLDIVLQFTQSFFRDLPNPAFFLQLREYKKGEWYIIPFKAIGKDISDSKNIRRL